jgi:hypothetical protein
LYRQERTPLDFFSCFRRWNATTGATGAVSDSDFLTCRQRKERLHREERLPWQLKTMVHPQRDTEADWQVGKQPPPIQVHTSQVFLDPELQGMIFVHVMRNCWCMHVYV